MPTWMVVFSSLMKTISVEPIHKFNPTPSWFKLMGDLIHPTRGSLLSLACVLWFVEGTWHGSRFSLTLLTEEYRRDTMLVFHSFTLVLTVAPFSVSRLHSFVVWVSMPFWFMDPRKGFTSTFFIVLFYLHKR